MNLQKNKMMGQRFIQALLLALLLNVSGHVFLHLGDSLWPAEALHLAATHEEKSSLPAQHFCSVCQDHQQLSLDTPALASIFTEAAPLLPTRRDDASPSSPAVHFKPTRAPPRS
jgi:hypothetical protein